MNKRRAKQLAEQAWANLYGEPEDLACSYGEWWPWHEVLRKGHIAQDFITLSEACLAVGFDQVWVTEPTQQSKHREVNPLVVSEDALYEMGNGNVFDEHPQTNWASIAMEPEGPVALQPDGTRNLMCYSRKRLIGRTYPKPGMNVLSWGPEPYNPEQPTLEEVVMCQHDKAYWHRWLHRQGHYPFQLTLSCPLEAPTLELGKVEEWRKANEAYCREARAWRTSIKAHAANRAFVFGECNFSEDLKVNCLTQDELDRATKHFNKAG